MGHEQPIAGADVEGPIRHKLTVEEFLILDEAGAFPSQYTELIDGEIYVLSPIYLPHSRTLANMTIEVGLAVRRLGTALTCFTPVSTEIDDYNLPMPDLVVAEDDGGRRFMAREAVRLVVEVSSSTLRHDLVTKAELYARSMFPEYWVVDVADRRVVRMHGPTDGAFTRRDEYAFGSPVPSATIPGLVVDTASL